MEKKRYMTIGFILRNFFSQKPIILVCDSDKILWFQNKIDFNQLLDICKKI